MVKCQIRMSVVCPYCNQTMLVRAGTAKGQPEYYECTCETMQGKKFKVACVELEEMINEVQT